MISSKETLEKANNGDAEAQFQMGCSFDEWDEYPIPGADYTKSVYWWTKAGDQNHPKALRKLGWCYQFAQKGVIRNEQKMEFCYKKAADLGDLKAQLHVGQSHYTGTFGFKQDYKQAFIYLEKASLSDSQVAQSWLGKCYELGHGVKKDLAQAIKWYKKAGDGEQGDEAARYSLGLIYLYGKGVKHSWCDAFKWLVETNAKAEVGYCYYFGYGIKQNKKIGLKFYLESIGKNSNYLEKISFIEKAKYILKLQLKRFKIYVLINRNRFCNV